jgi:AraC family transcriptional regulator
MQSAETIIDHRQRILRVVIHINNHLDKKLRIDHLSKIACYSPYHFIRVFEDIMGEPPQKYVFRKRMEQAGFNLLRRDWSITDVTFSLAYETPSSFCKCFKNFYGVSPRHFRDTTPKHLYHKTHHPFRGTYKKQKWPRNAQQPLIKHLPSLKVICIENRGAKAGSFRATAPESLERFENQIIKEDLGCLVGNQVSIYPFRPSGFEDREAHSLVGAIALRITESLDSFNHITLPEGRYAIFNHFGSYDFMMQTWNQAYANWYPRSGRTLRDSPPVEVYLDSRVNQSPREPKAYLMIPIH